MDFFFFVQCGNKSKSYISTSQSITKSFQGVVRAYVFLGQLLDVLWG